jgi:hypothetical protein
MIEHALTQHASCRIVRAENQNVGGHDDVSSIEVLARVTILTSASSSLIFTISYPQCLKRQYPCALSGMCLKLRIQSHFWGIRFSMPFDTSRRTVIFFAI